MRLGRFRRWAVGAVVIGGIANAVVVCHATPPSPSTFVRQVVTFTRVGDASSPLKASFSNGTDGSLSAVVGIWGMNDRRQLTVSDLLVTPGGHQAPETNAIGPTLGCSALATQPALLCQSRVGGTTYARFTITPSPSLQTRRVVLAFVGDRRLLAVHLEAGSKGWIMRRVSRPVRLLRTQDLSDTYLISAGESVEHFQTARLPGGVHGSLVAAAVPCRGLPPAGIATGVGSAVLSGARAPLALQCPNGALTALASATRATTWELHGDVWGSTSSGNQATSEVRDNTLSADDIRLLEVDGPF